MRRDDRDYLRDILRAARLIQDFVRETDWNEFATDLKTQSAVARQIEVVGEAAKRVSAAFRTAHPEVPWRKMAGMRDLLIHAYHSVEEDLVWNAATISVPELISLLEPLVLHDDVRDAGAG